MLPVKEVADAGRYMAFVIGGACRLRILVKDVTSFVQQQQAVLADPPNIAERIADTLRSHGL